MIETLRQPCWRLVNPDGTDWDHDDGGSPHFGDEQEAREYITEHKLSAGLTAAPFGFRCATVTCDGDDPEPCGQMLEDDDWGYIVHFPDGDDTRKLLDVYDFRAEPVPGAGAWCLNCQKWPHDHIGPDMECWRCGEPADEHAEDEPVIPRRHCDGQLSLVDGGVA